MVYDPIALDELPGPEQEHEVVIGVPGRKCTSDESVDKDVSGCEDLRTMEFSHMKNERPI